MLIQFIWLFVPLALLLLLVYYSSQTRREKDRFMVIEAAISLLSSWFLFLTSWLTLTIPLLLPLALYFAFRFYKRGVVRYRSFPVLARVLGLVPMAVALATLPAAVVYFASSYRGYHGETPVNRELVLYIYLYKHCLESAPNFSPLPRPVADGDHLDGVVGNRAIARQRL